MMGASGYIFGWPSLTSTFDWKNCIPSHQKCILSNTDSIQCKEYTYGQIYPHSKKETSDKQSKKSSIESNSFLDFQPIIIPPGETAASPDRNTNPESVASSPSISKIQKQNIQNGRAPKCAVCQNHGVNVLVKNHKRYCPWKGCCCYKCKLTYDRRRVMASQVAGRRAKAQDEEKAREFSDMQTLNSKSLGNILTRADDTILSNHELQMEKDVDSKSLPEMKHLLCQSMDEDSIHDQANEGKITFPPIFSNGGKENSWKIFGHDESGGINVPSSAFKESRPSVEPTMAKIHGANGETLLKWHCSSEFASDASVKVASPSLTCTTNANLLRGSHKLYPHFDFQPTETIIAIDEMKMSVKSLMELFHLPPQTEWLIYKILKDYRGDLKQASFKLFEAQCELRSWDLLREAAGNVCFTWNTS